jgi:hypothetical protein
MSKWRKAAKVDANQGEIVKQLRTMGYSVQAGHDDILVGKFGRTYWFEIKTSEKAQVKDSQEKLVAEWKGHYAIVWTTEMILREISHVED